mmetsp:Transcript_41382/g.108777  ORF Transcript_41382/g.108777 Transcript_41382/m.108777 type:complete len:111 (+) Transcript_41382:3-335(+)
MFDWEMVGLASGPQDVGQFLLNLEPDFCRQHARTCAQAYHAALEAAGVTGLTEEDCWTEIRLGGLGRWYSMVPFLCSMVPEKVLVFFYDNVKAFTEEWGVTPENAPAARF